MSAPSTNGSKGRDTAGRFTPGNAGGPGNPHARRVARLRSLLLERVGDDDLEAIVGALIEKARRGDVVAAREVLDRCLGKSKQALDVDMAVEEEHEREEKPLEQMSDLELAQTIQCGGLELPPLLQKKVDMVLAQGEEGQTPSQAAKPKKKPRRRKTPKKSASRTPTNSGRGKTPKKPPRKATKSQIAELDG